MQVTEMEVLMSMYSNPSEMQLDDSSALVDMRSGLENNESTTDLSKLRSISFTLNLFTASNVNRPIILNYYFIILAVVLLLPLKCRRVSSRDDCA